MADPESASVTIHLLKDKDVPKDTKEPSPGTGSKHAQDLTTPPGYTSLSSPGPEPLSSKSPLATTIAEPASSVPDLKTLEREKKGTKPDGVEDSSQHTHTSHGSGDEAWDCPVCFNSNSGTDPLCTFCGLKALNPVQILFPDKRLPVGGTLTSPNGLFKMTLEENGSFVIRKQGLSVWDSNTEEKKKKKNVVETNELVHTKSGRLILQRGAREAWAASPSEKSDTRLVMEDDGRLVFYSGREVVWSSDQAVPLPSNPVVRAVSAKSSELKKKAKEHKEKEDLKKKAKIDTRPFHLMTIPELEEELKIKIDQESYGDFELKNYKKFGLSSSEAKARLERDGPNTLTPPKETPALQKFVVEHLGHPLMLLLQVAGILSFIAYGLDTTQVGNLYTAVVLFIAVLISSGFAQVQEGKASDAMKEFKKMLPSMSNYVRDGELQEKQNADVLVVGDIVKVGTGDQVPADLRIIWNKGCRVECSSLTGESKPIACTLTTEEKRIQNATNLLFSSSIIIEGDAVGVVYATGDNTLMGEIAKDASATATSLTPVQREIKLFVRNLSIFAFILAIIFFILGAARGQNLTNVFVNAFIVVFVACVPEGLPMTVTSCLAITARRLAKKHIFIKELRSVETLGSCTVIASDKTGTLTQNRMSVSNLWINNGIRSCEDFVRVSQRDATIRKQSSKTIMARQFSQGRALEKLPKALKVADPGVIYSRPGPDAPPLIRTPSLAGTNEQELLKLIICVCNSAKFKDEVKLTVETAADLEIKEALIRADPTATINTGLKYVPGYAHQIHPSLRMTSMKTILGKYLGNLKAVEEQKPPREVSGEGIEVALLQFAYSITNVELFRFHWPVVYDMPFNSRQKCALCIVKPNNVDGFPKDRRRLLIKGGPDILKKRCSKWIRNGEVVDVDEEFERNYEHSLNSFAHEGERILGFAYMDLDEKEYGPDKDGTYTLDPKPNFPQEGYTYVGLISCKDPPKKGVKKAVEKCKRAGLRFMMVTGDYPPTAEAIARQVSIITQPTRFDYAIENRLDPDIVKWDDFHSIVIEGAILERFTEKTFDLVLRKKEIVFARTIPSQKKAIVSNLQRLGEVVAVTGDGVNDAPALKQADIGLAMGKSGSDCSRAAAAVVLMDDNLASIVVGIKLGRTIFDNLVKTICYTLSHLIPEVMTVLLALAASYPPALSTLLILVIDLGTELAPAVSLAYEGSEGDVMERPPRNSKKESLVNYRIVAYTFFQGGLIMTAFCYMAFALVLYMHGFPNDVLWLSYNTYWATSSPEWHVHGKTFTAEQQVAILTQAQSAYWAMLTGTQVFHIFLCKTRTRSLFEVGILSNLNLVYGVGIEIALVVLILFVPSSWIIFPSAIFPGQIWGILGASWLTFFLWHEIIKFCKRHWPHSFVQHLLY